ncbi:replication-relaxation family protein [Metabacillus litoralis]|uniref:replication-relaxation family protein n=1 Tax=Metabacillus litoralis TaxID=152268 RepID=UPI00203DE3DC|nr:replication-relaxation family protein [Metabacillus litoralis]MCM3651353.1 replication-relaxation family protein [Metabacillus litoralis]
MKKCDYLTREQIQKMHDLGQVRNAQKVLYKMNDYISSFINGKKKIYYLNKKGRERVGATKIRTKTATVDHFLMRNDLYIFLGKPFTWKNEIKIKIPQTKISIIVDAMFKIDNKHDYFIEVDHKQSMKNNESKINRYKQLFEYNPNFMLIWVTTTHYRKIKLEALCEDLNVQVYLWDDIK